MSNLSKHIQAQSTNKRYAELNPLVGVCAVEQTTTYVHKSDLLEYNIGVTLGASVLVNPGNASHLDKATYQTKQKIIEAVFGEFRAAFRDINGLLWKRDYEAVGLALAEFEQKMFEVE